ncbi:MAG: Mu transposase C-terminal domain-containing protein, partial [Ruthenibacterium sp.]
MQDLVKRGTLPHEKCTNKLNRLQLFIPLSALPDDAQRRYHEQHGVANVLHYAERTPRQTREVDSYSEAERKEIDFWVTLLERWQYYRDRAANVNKSKIDAQFVLQCQMEHPELAISEDILYRRQRALRDGNMDGLLDKRGKSRLGESDMPDEVTSAFFTAYLTQSRLSIPRCIKAVEQWAKKENPSVLPLPSYSTFYRKMQELPLAVRILCREGPKAYYDKCSPYTRRQYETLGANDWWVGDTYTCDVMTRGPDGKTHRPYLSAWVDVRSGIFVGWNIAFDSNSQNTIYALRRAATQYGIPNNNFYVDNGREYLTYDLGGRGHRAKKLLADGSEAFAPPGIFRRMDVNMVNALVCNARAKLVERSFNDVKNYIMKLFPTYTGGHIKEKPERLKHVIKTDAVPTDEEFISKVNDLIEHYLNYEPYYGQVVEDKGKRRIDVFFERRLKTRQPTPEALRLMMLRTSMPVTVKRNGIEIDVRGGVKVWYYCDELCNRMQGKKVYARYDPDDLSSVRVYDEEDRFLLEVPRSTLEAQYGASQEALAAGEKKKRHAKKALVEFINTLVLPDGEIDPLALMLDLAEENKANPARDPGSKLISLEYPTEEPLLQ